MRAHALKRYAINECFYSLQGEGVRAGVPHVFLRFAGCNVHCTQDVRGFDCDTDYSPSDHLDCTAVVRLVQNTDTNFCGRVLLTGGEPTLQIDDILVSSLRDFGFQLAIETNGLLEVVDGIDWICVSPKLPDRNLQQRTANEVKYVLKAGDPLPACAIEAEHYLISPAFEVAREAGVVRSQRLPKENLEWCIALCQQNPRWRLSVQQHKGWKIR